MAADGEAGFTKIWYGCGIGKENNIRHSTDRSLGCRILIEEEQECGIRTPSQNLVGVTSHKHRNISSVCRDVRGDKIATLRTGCYIFYSTR